MTGKVYAADYASPTPANLITAIGDMQILTREMSVEPNPASEVSRM